MRDLQLETEADRRMSAHALLLLVLWLSGACSCCIHECRDRLCYSADMGTLTEIVPGADGVSTRTCRGSDDNEGIEGEARVLAKSKVQVKSRHKTKG